MVYFILPHRPKSWEKAKSQFSIAPDEYEHQLMEQWPTAKAYRPPPDSPYLLRWEILEGGRPAVVGGIQKDLQTVSVEPSDREALAHFVIWHRTIIASEQELHLVSEGMWESLELVESTTEEEIFRFTGLTA